MQDGFYYDFEFPPGVTLTAADFDSIEARMQAHVDADELAYEERVQRPPVSEFPTLKAEPR